MRETESLGFYSSVFLLVFIIVPSVRGRQAADALELLSRG